MSVKNPVFLTSWRASERQKCVTNFVRKADSCKDARKSVVSEEVFQGEIWPEAWDDPSNEPPGETNPNERPKMREKYSHFSGVSGRHDETEEKLCSPRLGCVCLPNLRPLIQYKMRCVRSHNMYNTLKWASGSEVLWRGNKKHSLKQGKNCKLTQIQLNMSFKGFWSMSRVSQKLSVQWIKDRF